MKDSRELTDVRKELELLADEPYRVFHSRLLPGTENILGVRVPRLWKLARRLVYKLPEKEIKLAIAGLVSEDVLVESDGGYLLKEDSETLKTYTAPEFHSVYALHRNDPLYKAFEPALKSLAKSLTEGLPYDCDPLQYLLIDGVFHGAVVGHFRNGPYDLNDVRIDDASLLSRKEEIIAAVQTVNFGALPQRFMGKKP